MNNDKARFGAIVAFAALIAAFAAACPLAAQDQGGVLLKNIKLPEYKGEKLQFILYGTKAESEDVRVSLRNVLIDLIRDDVTDVQGIKDHQSLMLYPINQDFEAITKFWLDNPHSRALLQTPSATYDRVSKLVSGDGTVHLRSPLMDINGVGFDADYDKKKIHIRSDVEVVIRNDMANINLGGKDKSIQTEAPKP